MSGGQRPQLFFEDLEIGRADLEDVFIEIMQSGAATRSGAGFGADGRSAHS